MTIELLKIGNQKFPTMLQTLHEMEGLMMKVT